jgi:hypothetical protein
VSSSGRLSLNLLRVRLFSLDDRDSLGSKFQAGNDELAMGAATSVLLKTWCGFGEGLIEEREGEERKLDVDVDGETSMERLRLSPIVCSMDAIDVGRIDGWRMRRDATS